MQVHICQDRRDDATLQALRIRIDYASIRFQDPYAH